MHIHIQPTDELPIYKQIVSQVRDGVASKRIQPGEKLPSQRDLAQQLVIAPLTVKKAYDQLELDGVIETRRGQGTFITAAPPVLSPADRRERMRTAVRRLVTDAWASGMPEDELIALIREEIEAARALRQDQTAEDKQP